MAVKLYVIVKKNFSMSRNEWFLYFAMVALIFMVMFFIPMLGIILYNAAYIPSVKFNLRTLNIRPSYKWNYNNSIHGAGNWEKYHQAKNMFTEIDKLNTMESSKVFGITKFSNMTKYEFAKQMLSVMPPMGTDPWLTVADSINLGCYRSMRYKIIYNYRYYKGGIPDRVDWRDKGVVGPVQNQRKCNACWAFCVVGLMESRRAINRKEHHTEDLSIQELLSCTPDTKKCEGGNIKTALYYLWHDRKPIVPASQCPLTLQDEDCPVGDAVTGTTLRCYEISKNVYESDIPMIIAAHGPVMAVVNADVWQYYTGGVIFRSCKRKYHGYKHVVQIVGYNKNASIPYYIVRNSWGTDFGEGGYVRLAMNHDICGITEQIAYLDVY